jgi:hypothetical protein
MFIATFLFIDSWGVRGEVKNLRSKLLYFGTKRKQLITPMVLLLASGLSMILSAGCGNSKTAPANLAPALEPAESAAPDASSTPAGSREPAFREMTVPAGTVLTVRLLQSVSSSSARPGDAFDAELANPVAVDGNVVFPKGTQIQGRVVSAMKSGRLQNPGGLTLALKAIKAPGSEWIDLSSSTINAQGKSHKKRNLTLIGGGSGVGALIGGVAGGGKGLAIGALSGAAAGTAGAAAIGQKDVTFSSEQILRFSLKTPLTLPLPS